VSKKLRRGVKTTEKNVRAVDVIICPSLGIKVSERQYEFGDVSKKREKKECIRWDLEKNFWEKRRHLNRAGKARLVRESVALG